MRDWRVILRLGELGVMRKSGNRSLEEVLMGIGLQRIRLGAVWGMGLWRRMEGLIMFIRMEVCCSENVI